ncbi:MAG: 7-carboxy-7-deazaguanine synthase QueE [Thaumarchaeota archaeon]|nr:7-carboxy-7-deazaguanine synthase QueE [Nitrososphaerota archaeon]
MQKQNLINRNLKVRLFEIFTSLEGEGILYGTKTLFVRLAGCPFSCFYCDTMPALPSDSGIEYGIEEARKLIDSKLEHNTYKVNFTGGEPLMQHEAVIELAKHIQLKQIPTYLESSCFDFSKFVQLIPYMNYIKIEFKTQDSQFVNQKNYVHILQNELMCLKTSIDKNKCPYIKILITSKTCKSEFTKLLRSIFNINGINNISGFVLQPVHGTGKPKLEKLLKFYDLVYAYYKEVRIIPQLHKFMDVS